MRPFLPFFIKNTLIRVNNTLKLRGYFAACVRSNTQMVTPSEISSLSGCKVDTHLQCFVFRHQAFESGSDCCKPEVVRYLESGLLFSFETLRAGHLYEKQENNLNYTLPVTGLDRKWPGLVVIIRLRPS
jgi:hypothetical protein